MSEESLSFVPIRLSTLRSHSDLDFDLYVSVGDKYVLYVKNGDDIQEERLRSLKAKKVKKLFIVDNDEPKYQAFIDRALFALAKDENVSNEEKAEFAGGVMSHAAEEIINNPESQEAFQGAQNAAKGIIEMIKHNPKILKDLYGMVQKSESGAMIKHSIGVAFLSLNFARFLGYDEKVIESLGIAGLIHDIGKVGMDASDHGLFEKNYDEMSPEELKRYKQHPQIGHDLLQDKEFVNKTILDLILIHEENLTGNGFPQGLTKLSPEQELFSLCCAFDRMTSLLGKTTEEAFEDFKINQLGNYDLKLINKFKDMVKDIDLTA